MSNPPNSPLTQSSQDGKASDDNQQELTVLCRLASRCMEVPVVALLLFSGQEDGQETRKTSQHQGGDEKRCFQPPCILLAQAGMEEGRLFNPEAPLFYQDLLESKMIIREDLTKVPGIGPLFFQPGNAAYRFLWTLPIAYRHFHVEQKKEDGVSPQKKVLLCLLDEQPRIPDALQLEKIEMLAMLIARCYSRIEGPAEGASRLKKLRHDLRTPLTSITMLPQLMKEDNELPEEIAFMCDQLLAAARKMDDLLSASENPS